MEMRKFKKSGKSTSLLGFGAMRFPLNPEGSIDESEATKMLEYAYEQGVNYFDTAYPYHEGESERFLGKVLKKFPRTSFNLATKLPCWHVNTLSDAKRIFADQLVKLDMDYVDFYLLHSIEGETYDRMVELGVVSYLESLKNEGKIKNFGFSFHGIYDDFERILTDRAWDFCQIQYNYLDTEEQAGTKGYNLAAKLEIPIVVMEPVKGGSLAYLPPELKLMLTSLDPHESPSSLALRWVANHPAVQVVLSGMSSMDHVKENLKTFSPVKPLTKKEADAILVVGDTLRSRLGNSCTRCRYCMPCPFGVDIPGNFSMWNRYRMFQNYGEAVEEWEDEKGKDKRPPVCTECGQCVPLCPQSINIPENLQRVQIELEEARLAYKP